jgi:hypothetical protein
MDPEIVREMGFGKGRLNEFEFEGWIDLCLGKIFGATDNDNLSFS